MSEIIEWPITVIEVLRFNTRQHKFDFDSVSIAVKQFCLEHKDHGHLAHEISAASCRTQFAADFAKQSEVSPSPTPPPVILSQPMQIQSSIENSSSQIMTANTDKYEDMTVAEIFALSEKLQADNLKRQDAVFERVLESMGKLTASSEALRDPNYIMVKSIYEDKKRTRERKESDRQRKVQEAEEQKELDEQREQLRQRFNNCDEATLEMQPGPVAESKVTLADFGIDGDEDEEISADNGARIPFNIDMVLCSQEFNDILTAVENDLGDLFGEENSELAEVFAFLDAARSDEQQQYHHGKLTSTTAAATHYRPVPGVIDDAQFLEFVHNAPREPVSKRVAGGVVHAPSSQNRTPNRPSPASAAFVDKAASTTPKKTDITPTSTTTAKTPKQTPRKDVAVPTAGADPGYPATTATTSVKSSAATPTKTPSQILPPAPPSGNTTRNSASKGLRFSSEIDDDDDDDDDLDKMRRNMKMQSQQFNKSTSAETPVKATVEKISDIVEPDTAVKCSENRQEQPQPHPQLLLESHTSKASMEQVSSKSVAIEPESLPQPIEEPAQPEAITVVSQVSGSLLAGGRKKRDANQNNLPMTASRPRKEKMAGANVE